MTKIKTIDACKQLDLHPAMFFQQIRETDPNLKFDDAWPEIEDGWVKTISAFLSSIKQSHIEEQQTSAPITSSSLMFSKNAISVLKKLSNKKNFGNCAVSHEALIKMAHLSKQELSEALEELKSKDFLTHNGHRDNISLNPNKNKFIEKILQKQTDLH